MSIALLEEKQRIVARFGDWTDHNIELAQGVYTIDEGVVPTKLRRIVQIVADVAGEPISGLRALDLACLEGQYAVELARHGAEVVAIEGRETNCEKARFAKRALSLDNLEVALDDVRNLSRATYGEFDVVLCLGILYHLDVPDVFRFVHSIAEVCTRFAVFDTFVGVGPTEACRFGDRTYHGRFFHEHDPASAKEDRLRDLWASLDNPASFWVSKHSLWNLLQDAGFTSVYECQVPAEPDKPTDRVTLLAIKGRRQRLLTAPRADEQPVRDWPEGHEPRLSPHQRPGYLFRKRLSSLVPKVVKRPLKSALAAVRRNGNEPWNWREPWRTR